MELLAPSVKASTLARKSAGLMERAMASPSMARTLLEFLKTIDVRAVLPAIRVPTIVLHRRDDFVPISAGRAVADGISGARFVELEGIDHVLWYGDMDAVVDEVEEFFTGSRHVTTRDRVLATVLFTDIVGSTEHNVRAGDDEWHRLLTKHNDIVRALLTEHRGREIKTIGDGFLAVFDGPARALRCAKAVVERVRDVGIEVRAGLHTGELELHDDGDIEGMAVNIGARIGAIAQAGQVLASATLKDLVYGSQLRFTSRGTHELKGLPGSWPLWSFDGESASDLPAQSPMDSMGAVSRASVKFMSRRPNLAKKVNKLLLRTRRSGSEPAPARQRPITR
jgi:class 3 adenylate cyclase